MRVLPRANSAGGWVLAAGLILGGASGARGQTRGSPGEPIYGKDHIPTQRARLREAQELLLAEYAPEFYDYQLKLRAIEGEIERTTADLADKKIDEREAKAKLLPWVKAELELQDDPAYLVAQRIARVALTSPEYRARKQKLLDQFAAGRRRERLVK